MTGARKRPLGAGGRGRARGEPTSRNLPVAAFLGRRGGPSSPAPAPARIPQGRGQRPAMKLVGAEAASPQPAGRGSPALRPPLAPPGCLKVEPARLRPGLLPGQAPPAARAQQPSSLPAPRVSPAGQSRSGIWAAMAGARLGRCPLLLLLLAGASPSPPEKEKAEPLEGAEDPVFLSEYFSQSSQALSFYSWYGSAKVFRFHVPEDTVLLRWLLQASRDKGPGCGSTQVTFQTLALDAVLQNSTFVNLTNPVAGDWFLAAHLPAASSRIEVKGFSRPCSYTFQPDLFVLRQLDVAVLEPEVPMQRVLSKGTSRPLHAKAFVPEYTAGMRLELGKCMENGSAAACALRVTVGASALAWPSQKVLRCLEACSIVLASPPWGRWLWITVEGLGGSSTSVSFQVVVFFTACKPGDAASFLGVYQSLKQSQGMPVPGGHLNGTLLALGSSRNTSGPGSACLRDQPVVREDLDVLSVRFRLPGDATVPVQSDPPTLLLLDLNSGMDSGGTLVLNLALNQTSVGLGNATVWACLSPASPSLSLNGSGACGTAFVQGYGLNVSMSSREAAVIVPYPQSDSWYLSLKLLCPKESQDCDQAEGQVAVLAYLTPCFDDCGTYGQCSLMRRYGYLYSGCICKAGWAGWSCTDGTKAQSVGTQTLATLLLTLSNLSFLPAIAVALCHYHLVEASVYTFTMFFSTFYHACDQPGIAVMCIMDYDTLQFCDFLGSVVSIWVTILCMAQVEPILKYVLCVLGTLVIAMSLQLDRRGVWNMMGPCVFALTIMASIWVYRGISRRRCYPPSWKRWVFFLFPGTSLALVAIAVYAFMETTENYYYTHSIWHILVASSVAFFLPPGDKQKDPWAWSRKLLCRYQICRNDQEELYTVR
ncbi:post-GPI attachment to proteins factor 6 isoform X2 [Erythrolamprus reginae]|uniref:post-GPI attachment to proteins factor 6 isoform X2 n=1 Tax=Erythrolamprus reginae TaxID=121349 RepID=UPI00396CD866